MRKGQTNCWYARNLGSASLARGASRSSAALMLSWKAGSGSSTGGTSASASATVPAYLRQTASGTAAPWRIASSSSAAEAISASTCLCFLNDEALAASKTACTCQRDSSCSLLAAFRTDFARAATLWRTSAYSFSAASFSARKRATISSRTPLYRAWVAAVSACQAAVTFWTDASNPLSAASLRAR